MARRRAMPGPIDMRSFAEGMSYAGIDPRLWISYATVDDQDSVTFDDDFGPMVGVTLQPSKLPAYCRVGGFAAGNGEAVFHPFVAGDELLVAIPQGDVRAGCVIIAKLNQATDAWPKGSIGGQDPTSNTFGFIRSRAPFVVESASMLMLSQAPTAAFITIDAKGSITLKDGAKDALQLTADMFGFQSADAKFLLQLDLTGGRFTLQVDDAVLVLSSSSAAPSTNALSVPGKLVLSTATNPAAEHVTTTEATSNVLGYLMGTMSALVSIFGATPIPCPSAGTDLAPMLVPLIQAAFDPIAVATAIGQAATASLDPVIAAAIFAAFGAASPKPPGVPGSGQSLPGIGCVGLISG